jgi:hypothetical protein
MEQTHCPTSENLQLGRLVADALSEIERLGYSRSSQNRYRATWEHLIAFARGIELGDEFSADLAASFLEEYGARDGQVDGPGNGWRRHMVFGVKALADFAKNGRIERAFTEAGNSSSSRHAEHTSRLRTVLQGSTPLHRRTTELTIFLDFLHSRKARTLDEIQAADLSDFVSSRITCSPRRSRESCRMCVPFSGFLPCVGFCRKISVRSYRRSVFPRMQLSRRFGITNSSDTRTLKLDDLRAGRIRQ